ncbi:MAG: hypothetical protein P1U74_02010 [Legionellaceae bacterium]|nr:hypothetical protein [Legionellaceae bacterium]
MIIILKNILKNIIFFSIIITSSNIYASDVRQDKNEHIPTNLKHASWVFSGMVENEFGEFYNYLFQMQRNENDFLAIVAIFDFQTKKIIFHEESTSKIQNPEEFPWVVGNTFLRFNNITNSWVFGYKGNNSYNFNFKVNMLKRPEEAPVTNFFRDGLSFEVVQAGQLNGHIRVQKDGKDQFVTAKNTWFRQVWVTHPNSLQHLKGLLCTLDDGKGLYAMRVFDSSSLQDTIAGLFDSEGKSFAVSQFISVDKNNDDAWKINIPTPKMDFFLKVAYQKSDLIAGFISNDNTRGFCLLSQDETDPTSATIASIK